MITEEFHDVDEHSYVGTSWVVGQISADVWVGDTLCTLYGGGWIDGEGDIVLWQHYDDEIGDPTTLMAALGHAFPRDREKRLHGAALASAERRWERLRIEMTEQLGDLLPASVTVPDFDEVDADDEEEEKEDEWA